MPTLPKDSPDRLAEIDESANSFWGHIASGLESAPLGRKLMPALGDNPDIACYMDGRHVDMRKRCAPARFAAQESEPG